MPPAIVPGRARTRARETARPSDTPGEGGGQATASTQPRALAAIRKPCLGPRNCGCSHPKALPRPEKLHRVRPSESHSGPASAADFCRRSTPAIVPGGARPRARETASPPKAPLSGEKHGGSQHALACSSTAIRKPSKGPGNCGYAAIRKPHEGPGNCNYAAIRKPWLGPGNRAALRYNQAQPPRGRAQRSRHAR